MPRARSIKPGFFTDAELLECPPWVRLLFIGVWTVADRAGRLEDRPKQIRVNIFPGDDFDVDDGLSQLAAHRLVVRYEVDGRRYIQIANFAKHQNPHQKEPASIIPAPAIAGQQPGDPGSGPDAPGATSDGPGVDAGQAPDLHDAGTGQAPGESVLSPADSGLRTPDSGLQTADCGLTPNGDAAASADGPADLLPEPPKPPDTPFTLYAALCEAIDQDPSVLAEADKGKQLAVAKRLLQKHESADDIRRCAAWLASMPFTNGDVDMFTLERFYGRWVLAKRPAPLAKPGPAIGSDAYWADEMTEDERRERFGSA
jgi:hypothetical protein